VPAAETRAHDIPNAQVDRAIQVTVRPGLLEVDYEVSLAELTLNQDLRRLIGPLPAADRQALFERYGRETGPLNAKGFLVTLDGRPFDLQYRDFEVSVEQHPRYVFHLQAELPRHGRLRLQDLNYTGSEGTSRLALRALEVAVRGYDGPKDVADVTIRPVWQLTDEEEARTKQLAVDFESARSLARPPPVSGGEARERLPDPASPLKEGRPGEVRSPTTAERSGLPALLDRLSGTPLIAVWLGALALGMAHAVQPGHGKTLVAAATVGESGKWWRGVVLALITTATHMGSVLLVSAGLWLTRSTRFEAINAVLARMAGFAIAAFGLWRLGRHLGGYGEHDAADMTMTAARRGIIGLGVAGGLVPCWEAILLVTEAEMLGRLALGLVLLSAFSLGMAVVLVVVGLLSADLRRRLERREPEGPWPRRLGIASGLALTAVGVYLLAR
jgi:ABC-type nickel/cobalt efflux system permease component RcnA